MFSIGWLRTFNDSKCTLMTCSLAPCLDAEPQTPGRAMLWTLRKLGIEEWLCSSYKACMTMPEAECVLVATWVKSPVWKFTCLSQSWKPSQEFRTCENLYADGLVIITESLKELQEKLLVGKTNMVGTGLRVNMGKPRSLYLGQGLMSFRSLAKAPVAGVSTNSIFCGGCSSWIHRKFSGIPGSLKPGPSFRV